MRESKYERDLKVKLRKMFPGCHIQRNDPREHQGIPDILILWGERWAMLEVKQSASAPSQPNQPYHVDAFNTMSFAAFIYPENEEQVLDELQRSLGSPRQARVS